MLPFAIVFTVHTARLASIAFLIPVTPSASPIFLSYLLGYDPLPTVGCFRNRGLGTELWELLVGGLCRRHAASHLAGGCFR